MKIRILTTLAFLLCFGLVNISAQEETPKEQKKIVIVKKTVDKDGNETIEKIVKEGAEADIFIEEHKDVDMEGGKKEIKVRVKKAGDGENIWISDDNEVIDLEGNKFELRTNGSADGENIQRKIKIVTKDGNGEGDVIEWDGDGEMPDDLLKRLEEKGIDIKTLDGGNGVFMYKTDGEEGDHHINIEIDGMEDLSPEMKKKIHRIHKSKGHHDGDHDFVFKSEKINTNKAFLGVNIENVEDGVKVTSVIEESAAAEAGIMAGDIIKSISGKKASDVDELIDALTPFKPGDEVAVSLDRNGVATQVKAVLKERTDLHSHEGMEEHEEIEVIIIRDCDTNFSGDEDLDIIFNTIGDDEEKEIEVIVIQEGEVDENGEQEMEVTVEIVDDEAVVDVQQVVEKVKEAPVLNTERLKNMSRLKLKDFNAFPNPTNGVLNVSFSGKKGPMVMQMTDISGKEVYKNTLNNFDGQFDGQINFDGLAKGNYVLFIIQSGQVFTDTIIFN